MIKKRCMQGRSAGFNSYVMHFNATVVFNVRLHTINH